MSFIVYLLVAFLLAVSNCPCFAQVNLQNALQMIGRPLADYLVARFGYHFVDSTKDLMLELIKRVGYSPKTPEEEIEAKKRIEEYLMQEKTRLESERADQTFDPYDLDLNIDSLRNVGHQGWNVTIRKGKKWGDFGNADLCSNPKKMKEQESTQQIIELHDDISGCIISFLGFFNTGKTWLINYLFNTRFRTGRDLQGVTKGAGVHSVGDNVFVVDTEGARRTASEDMLQDRLATDQFIQSLALGISHMLVFQVDVIYATDVEFIKNLYKRAKTIASRVLKEFVVVHNFHDFQYESEVEHHIHSDIEIAFGIKKHTVHSYLQDGTECKAWKKGGIVHIVMAREGTSAGKKFNQCAMNILTSYINTVKTSVDEPVNFLCSVTTEVTALLPQYFYHPKYNETKYKVPIVVPPSTLVSASSSSAFKTEKESLTRRFMNRVGLRQWFQSAQSKNTFLPNQNEVNCEEFISLKPIDFLVITQKTDETHGKIITKDNITLNYLPSELETAVFQPDYDILNLPNKWGVIADVGDSSYRVDFHENYLAIRGCRAIPKDIDTVHIYDRVKDGRNNQRKYSVYEIIVQCPFNCVEAFQAKAPTHDNGVLKITFDRPVGGGDVYEDF